MNPETPPSPHKHPLLTTLPSKIAVASLAAATLASGLSMYLSITTFNKEFDNQMAATIIAPRIRHNLFKDVSIEGRAALVYEVNTHRVMYQKNPDTPLPLASITKIMTALVASNDIQGDPAVTITPESFAINGDNGLKENQEWKFSELLNFTLLESSNDGADALAAAASAFKGENFIDEMNTTAETLNLKSMNFSNSTGLDSPDGSAGSSGSARDVAALLEHIITEKPALLEVTKFNSYPVSSLDNTSYLAENTNLIANEIPGLIASKTGYTALAGGNLAIAFDAGLNNPIIVVVLGSSEQGRFGDVLTLAKLAQQSL